MRDPTALRTFGRCRSVNRRVGTRLGHAPRSFTPSDIARRELVPGSVGSVPVSLAKHAGAAPGLGGQISVTDAYLSVCGPPYRRVVLHQRRSFVPQRSSLDLPSVRRQEVSGGLSLFLGAAGDREADVGRARFGVSDALDDVVRASCDCQVGSAGDTLAIERTLS